MPPRHSPAVEAVAFLDATAAIQLASDALAAWHTGRLDRGCVLNLLAEAGERADRATAKEWAWLDERQAS